eukprot:scaffold433_cov260-Chaetoceros_neogracile.AAC.45
MNTHRVKIAFNTDLLFPTNNKEIGIIRFLVDGIPDIDAIDRVFKPLLMIFTVMGQFNYTDSGILALLTIDNAFKDSSKIEGIIYTYNDGTLNVTELSSGEYPFPTDQIIATTGLANIRTKNKTNKKGQNKFAYSIFPDGHSEMVNT